MSSLEGLAEHWDHHSLAEHWDETHEVAVEVHAMRRRRVTLDPEVYSRVEAQARLRGVSAETLVNLCLAQHLGGAAKARPAARRPASRAAG